jgi:hypothetical protein
MKQYDETKYRALGIGERIEKGDYVVRKDPEFDCPPTPVTCTVGELVTEDDALVYLRPIDGADSSQEGYVKIIAGQLGITTDIGIRALRIALSNVKVLDDKQKDYGSGNIAAFGEYGVLVRVWDKVSRLRNLLTNVSEPKNESIEDTWLDLCNYAIIATLCRRGEWK